MKKNMACKDFKRTNLICSQCYLQHTNLCSFQNDSDDYTSACPDFRMICGTCFATGFIDDCECPECWGHGWIR